MTAMLHSKRFRQAAEQVDRHRQYQLVDAVALLRQLPAASFDESVELAIALYTDPQRSDQALRGTVVLPHGTGKAVRVAVFCEGEHVSQARDAGADTVGGTELIQKVHGGWLDFDVAIASPAMMRDLTKVAKILGPRGLMPSPKAGTVREDVAQAIKEIKGGKVQFRQDKQGSIHAVIGKRSFENQALVKNAHAFCGAVTHARPPGLKGPLVRSATMSSTMGPGIPLDVKAAFTNGTA